MTKRKLGLLLLSVAVVAVLLSGCFLFPTSEDTTPPQLSVTPTNLTVPSGGNVHFLASASDNSGIQKIVAEFDGTSTTVSGSNSVVFDFTAPTVTSQTSMFATVTAYDNSKNHNKNSALVSVIVLPPEGTNVTYGVELNNSNHIYMYPVGPQENGSVIFSVHIFSGESLVNGVNVFVDGQQISSTPTVNTLKSSVQATTTKKEYTFFYAINAEHAGPHAYYVKIYGSNNQVLETSSNQYFYIIYPDAQKVELSEATPVHNASYVTGNISFTATATDYTSNYEAFLVNGTPFGSPLVDYTAATNIITTLGATKIVNKVYTFKLNTASMTDGPATFVFKDVAVSGTIKNATRVYTVDNTPPILTASYKSIPSSGTTLYVGADPTTFDVYAYDVNWMSSAATLGTAPVALAKNGTRLVDVAGLANNATETFTAWVKDYADHETSLALTIIRDTVAPVVHAATITTGLATISGVPYSGNATITVEASVTDTNLKSVAFVLDGPNYTFPMTKNASTGLWTAEVDLTGVLPGTYHASIIATDLALNEAPFDTVPATVNVYKPMTAVFTTSLETTPSAPVNGFVKSATITVNINPDWIYAVKNVYLYNGATVVSSRTGTASATYYFASFSGTGTYSVVVEDTVNATVTDGLIYDVNIDSTSPSTLNISPATSTVSATLKSFGVSATDTQSGVASLELLYQTLGATGANNGSWVTADSTSGNKLKSATLTWHNINTLPDGKYNIKIVAIDGVGNTSEATGYVINNNAGKPDVTFTFPSTWTNSTETVVTIGVTVKNESDVTITATSASATLINFDAAATTSNSYTAYPFTATWSATFTGANATSLAQATVTDLAGSSVTATKVIGFDNVKPTATPTASATVAGSATFTVTVTATDNLSAIKSVTIGGVAATLAASSSTNEFGVLNGTYVATLTAPDYTTSGPATFDIFVFDNAENEATSSISVYVDVTAPTITVEFAGTGVTPSVTINSGATYTVYAKNAATVTITATDDSEEGVTLNATIGSWPSSNTAVTAKVSSPLSVGTYAITAVATDEYGHTATFDTATVTVVIDASVPTAALDVPATLSLANFDTAVATYTATDTYFYEATLTIDGKSISVAQASPATVLLNSNAFGLNTVDGTTVNATLTVADKAGNITTATKSFYVDTVAPAMSVNKTLYKSGNTYYLDIQFSEDMYSAAGTPATITFLSSSDVVFDVNGVYYYLDASATLANTYTNDNGKGLLHISQLLTTSGATTNVLPLAGNTVTITLNSAKFVDKVSNELSNSPYTVTFTPYSAPKPVNP